LRYRSLLAVVAVMVAMGCFTARAQEPFPGEPPPGAKVHHPRLPGRMLPSQRDPGVPILKVTSNLVLVPTLVMRPDGQTVYDLKASDFTVLDNGVPQKVHLDSNMDLAPVSMVVCVQRGRDAPMVREEIAQLGQLLQLFVGGGHGDVALVEFDSRPVYLDAFSPHLGPVENDLANMAPGDGGAAIMDAVGFSLDLLEHQPSDHRKILLLVSESRDHGSVHVSIPSLVQRVGETNTLVLSLIFSPARAEFGYGLKHAGSGSGLLGALLMAYNAMRKNVPKTLVRMSGGEYANFSRDKRFQMDVVELANDALNRYLLSFHPSNLTAGLHHLQVKVNIDEKARVIYRTSYWAPGPSG
jgi:VWFA-related protein